MSGHGETKTVLLIEDNPGDIRLTRELLEEEGIEGPTHVFSNGDDALEFLHQQNEYGDAPRPDLILLDWHLQRMSGDEILAEVKSHESLEDIPVAVLSGSGTQIDRLKEKEPQADRYLTKPIDPEEYRNIKNDL